MANRYWAAGVSGNWNSTSSWSTSATGTPAGASVPGSADAAIFNAASGTVTATLDISPTVQTVTCTGFTGTLAFGTNTITLNSTGIIFIGATTMTVTGTPLIICTAITTTVARTVSPQSVTEANSISFRFTNSTAGLTLSGGSYRDLDFTDGTNPTGFGGALAVNSNIIYGSFKASTNMSATPGTSAITFTGAVTGTRTIDTAGVTFDRPFTFNSTATTPTNIIWRLQSAFTSGNTRTTTLTAGTLDLNGYVLSTGIFSGTGSGARHIVSGAGFFTISGDSTTVVNFGTSTNLTSDVPPTFNLSYSGSASSRTISAGFSTNLTSAPNINVLSGSDTVTTSGTSTLRDLTFQAGFTGILGNATRNIYGSLTMHSGMATPTSGSLVNTFNGVGTHTVDSGGKPLDFPVQFNGTGTWTLQQNMLVGPTGAPSTRTLTINAGNVVLNNFSITAGAIDASSSSTRSIAFGSSGKLVSNIVGNGTGVNTTALTLNTSTGLTYTGTSRIEIVGAGVAPDTRTISGPVSSSGGTESNVINIYVTNGADTLAIGTVNRMYRTLDFSGFTGNIVGGANPVIYGDLVLGAGMTITSGALSTYWTFSSSYTQTITTNSVLVDVSFEFDGVGTGLWTLQDALTMGSTRTLKLTNGQFNTNTYAVSSGAFSSSNTNTRTLSMAGTTWSIVGGGTSAWQCGDTTGLTVNATGSTISMTSASTKTFNSGFTAGGGRVWGTLNQGGVGDLSIAGDGNSFYNLTNQDTFGAQVTSTTVFANALTVDNFNLNGASFSQRIYFDGTSKTITKTSGAVGPVFATISNSNATGGAVFTAFPWAGNIDGGGNTGWLFSLPPDVGSGSGFFIFFEA